MARKPRKFAGPRSKHEISSEKLKPTEQLIPLLNRPRLKDKLSRGHERRLTFVPAPALAKDMGLALDARRDAKSAATPWRERWQQQIVPSRLVLRQENLRPARQALEAVSAETQASGNDRARIRAQVLLALFHDGESNMDASAEV